MPEPLIRVSNIEFFGTSDEPDALSIRGMREEMSGILVCCVPVRRLDSGLCGLTTDVQPFIDVNQDDGKFLHAV